MFNFSGIFSHLRKFRAGVDRHRRALKKLNFNWFYSQRTRREIYSLLLLSLLFLAASRSFVSMVVMFTDATTP